MHHHHLYSIICVQFVDNLLTICGQIFGQLCQKRFELSPSVQVVSGYFHKLHSQFVFTLFSITIQFKLGNRAYMAKFQGDIIKLAINGFFQKDFLPPSPCLPIPCRKSNILNLRRPWNFQILQIYVLDIEYETCTIYDITSLVTWWHRLAFIVSLICRMNSRSLFFRSSVQDIECGRFRKQVSLALLRLKKCIFIL